MIRVNLSANERSRKVRITVKGHAQTAAHGSDIVCAAASMVTMMIAQHIKDLCDHVDGMFKGTPKVMTASGDALFELTCASADAYRLLRHDLIVLTRGYFLLGYNYSERVKVAAKGDFAAPSDT